MEQALQCQERTHPAQQRRLSALSAEVIDSFKMFYLKVANFLKSLNPLNFDPLLRPRSRVSSPFANVGGAKSLLRNEFNGLSRLGDLSCPAVRCTWRTCFIPKYLNYRLSI